MGYKDIGRLLFVSCLIVLNINLDVVQATEIGSSTSEEFLEPKYSELISEYEQKAYLGQDIIYDVGDIVTEESKQYEVNETMGYSSSVVLDLTRQDEVKLNLEVEKSGVYYLSFDYYDYSESVLPVEFSLKVNEEYPYYELRSILLESNWRNNEEIAIDRYGNQIVSMPTKIYEWNQKKSMMLAIATVSR